MTLALHRNGPDARIVALDPAGPMLKRLRVKAGIAPWLTLHDGTLQSMTNPGLFDLCVSQLALAFVPEPKTELAILRRTTNFGGQLAVTVLREAVTMAPFFTHWTAVRQVLRDAIAPEQYPHYRFANGGELQRMAETAGWWTVRVTPLASERICSEASLWRWLSTTLPIQLDTGETTDLSANPQMSDTIRQSLLSLVEPYRQGSAYHLPTAAWLLTATAG